MAYNEYRFTNIAKKDLFCAFEYISNYSNDSEILNVLYKKIEETIKRICDYPEIYSVVINNKGKKKIRKAVINDYLLYYFFDSKENMIYIVRFLYGRRDLEEILNKMWCEMNGVEKEQNSKFLIETKYNESNKW